MPEQPKLFLIFCTYCVKTGRMKNTFRKNSSFWFVLFVSLFIFSSCGISKYVPEGSLYLKKNKVKIENKEISSGEVNSLIVQDPNKEFFGMKIKMRIFCLSKPNSNNWWNKFLRKTGEPPAIYDPALADNSLKKMDLYLKSKGCFTSEENFSLETKKNRTTVVYHVNPSKRYKINKVEFFAEDSAIQSILDRRRNPLLKKGMYYDEKIFSEERDNITNSLRNRGYFAFSKENIFILVDTNFNTNEAALRLEIKNPPASDSIAQGKHHIYQMKNVYIYPSIDLNQQVDTIEYNTARIDIFRKELDTMSSYTFLYQNKMDLNPNVILRSVFIDPGANFSTRQMEQTYSGIAGLKNYKFVNIEYRENTNIQAKDYGVDAYIRMTQSKRHTFSTSLELNNTSASNASNTSAVANLGIELNFRYQNKNLFGNGEILNTKYRLAVDFPTKKSDEDDEVFNNFETGLDLGIDIPKFLFPIKASFMPRSYHPRTTFNFGFNYQDKSIYKRSIPNAGFGYKWNGNSRNEHGIYPVELTAVKMFYSSQEFKDSIDNMKDPRVKTQYTDHLVTDTRYSFLWSDQSSRVQRDFSSILFNAESAGNIFYLFNTSLDSPQKDGKYTIIGVPYSQYVRADIDMKHYFYLTQTIPFIIRGYIGAGITYGNSYSMPYEKSFFAGGPSNIRGWRMKSLGPGGFQNLENTPYDRTGDISLCINLETRFPLFSIFEGAAFVDMGNIWMQRESSEFPGGSFDINDFYKEIAVSAGLGLRLNISFFVFRFDFAVRMRDPARDIGDYWMIDKLQFKDIVLNFGIGYPF